MLPRGSFFGVISLLALLALAMSNKHQPIQPVVVQPETVVVQPVPTPTPAPQPVQAKFELIDLYSTYCLPCKQMEPTINRIEARGVRVQRINVDQDPKAAEYYHISGTPTYIIKKDGREVERVVGPIAEAELLLKLGVTNIQGALLLPEVLEEPAPPIKPVIAENGWRLRVFYPIGEGKEILDLFVTNPEFAEFGNKYGYDAYATNDLRFEAWRKEGYPTDRVTVVLVDSKDRVVFRTENVNNPSNLLASLQSAADRPIIKRVRSK